MGQFEMYDRVAKAFAARIHSLFETEETLQKRFTELLPHTEFTRTDHWSFILRKEFSDIWKAFGPEVKAEPTQADITTTLKLMHPMLDYNLFTQVLMNLQNYLGMAYAAMDAQNYLKDLELSWEKHVRENPKDPNPFALKAKMFKTASTDVEKRYNEDLSAIKALRIIAAFTPMNSFRVSPKGSTPAFADSKNLSMIGIGGDRFVRVMPQLRVDYLVWPQEQTPTMTTPIDGKFRAEGIPYLFTSKSGGEILNTVLFARKLTYDVFNFLFGGSMTGILLPRMNSVMVVSSAGNLVNSLFTELHYHYPMLELHEGQRKF